VRGWNGRASYQLLVVTTVPVRARGQAGRDLNVKTCVRTEEQGSSSSREGWKRRRRKGEGSVCGKGWNCLTISSNKCWREME
jgi:hypothetical protein